MTNDGELAHLLMHPKHEIEKRYVVKVKGDLSSAQLRLLEDGIRLEDGMTAPAKAAVLARSPVSSTVEITIHEGRNRQVRRMFEAIGHPVLHLKRVGYGFLTLGGLKSGEMRPLTSNEVRQLAELASRASS
jgi:23S rRNA pseudouridine2605 synthase